MSEETNLVVTSEVAGKLSETVLAQELGDLFGMPGQSIINLVRAQIIAVPEGHQPATAAELAFVMTVMRTYKLNPMLKQIHAWRDKYGKLNTMIGYDGWVEYARRQPAYQFVSYKFGPIVESPDKKGQKCWEWVQPVIHDAEHGEVEMVPVFLDEWYVKQRGNYPEPWQKQTRHRLHLKAFTSAIREFYGLGGVVDEADRDIMKAEYHRTEFATEDATARLEEAVGLRVADETDPSPEQPTSDAPDMEMADAVIVRETQPCADCTTPTSVKCLQCGAYVCEACMAPDGSQCATCATGGSANG